MTTMSLARALDKALDTQANSDVKLITAIVVANGIKVCSVSAAVYLHQTL